MKRILLLTLGFLVFSFFSSLIGQVYDARMAGKEVLTPLPALTPRINGIGLFIVSE